MADVEAVIRRYEKLKADKSAWHQHWDDLARVMLPRRRGFASTTIEGESRMEDVFDGTPMQAVRGLANAMGGLLRPDGRDWFSIRADKDSLNRKDDAKAWLADAEDRLRSALENPKARFRQATGETDLDLVVFGTGVMFVGEGSKLNHLLFQSVHLKDAVVFFNDEGEPEGMFRCRKMTIRQAMGQFGKDNLSENTRRKIQENKIDEKIDILHAVLPREEGRIGALLSRNLPFTNNWIELKEKHLVKTGGFHEFPFVVPRWDTSSGEDYGRSPGMIALPDANTLQAMGETLLVAGQRAADPPLFAPNDGSFDAINTFPGALSYYDVDTAISMRGNPFFPLETGSNMPLTREMQADMRDQVFSAFFRNVLNLPIDRPKMTATEVIERKEEFIREIGPVFGRLESDYTAPMIERAFNIMLRAGAFAPIPESLQGESVRFEYESPVKKIREQAEATAARLWAVEMAELSQIDPDALDLPNVDFLGRFSAEALGLPHEAVRGNQEVQRRREARAQARQEMQQAEQVQQGVEAAEKAASAASKAGLTERAA